MSPNLGAEMVGVVVDDKITKEPAGGCGGLESVDCVAEIPGDPLDVGGVDVAAEFFGWLDLVGDAVEARGKGSGVGEVRIDVGARDPVLDTQARSGSDDTEPGGAVVGGPGKPGRRPRLVPVALV